MVAAGGAERPASAGFAGRYTTSSSPSAWGSNGLWRLAASVALVSGPRAQGWSLAPCCVRGLRLRSTCAGTSKCAVTRSDPVRQLPKLYDCRRTRNTKLSAGRRAARVVCVCRTRRLELLSQSCVIGLGVSRPCGSAMTRRKTYSACKLPPTRNSNRPFANPDVATAAWTASSRRCTPCRRTGATTTGTARPGGSPPPPPTRAVPRSRTATCDASAGMVHAVVVVVAVAAAAVVVAVVVVVVVVVAAPISTAVAVTIRLIFAQIRAVGSRGLQVVCFRFRRAKGARCGVCGRDARRLDW